MKILTVLLAIGLMTTIFTRAVLFHRSTICRQKVWQEGFVSITRSLLTGPKSTETILISGCGTISRKGQEIRNGQAMLSLSLPGKL